MRARSHRGDLERIAYSRSTEEGYFNWELLDTSARDIIDSVLTKWERLLGENHREEVYQQFLVEHATLFFCDGFDRYLTLSKIRLGADHVIDLAVPTEEYSMGLYWNLIELELPNSAPYTKRGDPSKELSHGVQQIQDWRRWIIRNRDETRRVFPCFGVRTLREPNFSFTLFIGTRENSSQHLEKRNQLAEELRIGIRSFDYLSTLFEHNLRFNELTLLSGNVHLPRRLANRLANPFAMALPDREWRALLQELRAMRRPYLPGIAELLAERQRCNTKLLSQFKKRFKRNGQAEPC